MKIVSLRDKITPKFGFQKVNKKKRQDPERLGQLNLFEPANRPKIIQLPISRKPFEIALALDEQEDMKAEKVYLRAIEEGDRVADAWCNLGIIKSKKKLHRDAIDCFKNSLQENPEHFESNYNLANLYFDMGYLEPARVHYELAAKLDPEFPNLYFNLGLLLAIENRFEEAEKSLVQYCQMNRTEDEEAEALLQSLRESLQKNPSAENSAKGHHLKRT